MAPIPTAFPTIRKNSISIMGSDSSYFEVYCICLHDLVQGGDSRYDPSHCKSLLLPLLLHISWFLLIIVSTSRLWLRNLNFKTKLIKKKLKIFSGVALLTVWYFEISLLFPISNRLFSGTNTIGNTAPKRNQPIPKVILCLCWSRSDILLTLWMFGPQKQKWFC